MLAMNFWNPKHFDFTDALNQEIWVNSPKVQQQIQQMEALTEPGSVGAQQAMLDADLLKERGCPLPWVPDLVGRESQNKSGLTIIGLAYAGFISEYSSRKNTMPLDDYCKAASAEEFQRSFLKNVVLDDAEYYDPISILCGSFGDASKITFLDLCRASFVKRGLRQGRKFDISDTKEVIKGDSALYEKYVEHKEADDWLWRRFIGNPSRCVLALGLNAEHGLIQMFFRHGMKITQGGALFTPKHFASGGWAKPYADPKKKLGYWLRNSTWWTVQGAVNGANRTWYVLPVYHPRHYNDTRYDPNYTKAKTVLKLMQNL